MGWLEERQLPRKEENEKSHKCEWSQGEWNFLLLCKKEGFMRQVSKTERDNSFFFFFFSILFLTAPCLHCCARVFSSCGEWGTTLRCSAGGSHPCGLSCCGAQAPGTKALRAPALGLSSCSLQARELKLNSCGAMTQPLHSTWNLPRPGTEP